MSLAQKVEADMVDSSGIAPREVSNLWVDKLVVVKILD